MFPPRGGLKHHVKERRCGPPDTGTRDCAHGRESASGPTHLRHDSGRLDAIPKIPFTGHSRLAGMMGVNRKGHPSGTGTGTMIFWSAIMRGVTGLREFLAPSYHPERHYMRGPGPACARRAAPGFGGRPSFQ